MAQFPLFAFMSFFFFFNQFKQCSKAGVGRAPLRRSLCWSFDPTRRQEGSGGSVWVAWPTIDGGGGWNRPAFWLARFGAKSRLIVNQWLGCFLSSDAGGWWPMVLPFWLIDIYFFLCILNWLDFLFLVLFFSRVLEFLMVDCTRRW